MLALSILLGLVPSVLGELREFGLDIITKNIAPDGFERSYVSSTFVPASWVLRILI
jgi:hypothetical protein